jgi:maleate cis-trans isomerase
MMKPVLSSNQATFWAALRTIGCGESIHGFGELLREY